MSGPLFNRQFKETQASPDSEAVGRGPKGGASEEEVKVMAPPRMDNDFEGLLLGSPPFGHRSKAHGPSESEDGPFAKRRVEAVGRRHPVKPGEEAIAKLSKEPK